MKLIFLALLLISSILIGCGGGSDGTEGNNGDGKGNNKPQKASYVNWEAVPSDFNPSIDTIPFNNDGVEKINLDNFGFDKDVEVIYTNDVRINEGTLKIFKVWKKQVSWGYLEPKLTGKNLDLKSYGSYQCSIRVQNNQIVELEGGCYVKVQIMLPINSEIEVYNIGQLITRRFIPMDNETFFNQLNDATWADDKFTVIENYLASYVDSKKPSLTCNELGKIIHEFMYKEEKFKVLGRLHSIVSNRQNLSLMIESEFSYFDRGEARKIVGLD
jgi:hypothetical protein